MEISVPFLQFKNHNLQIALELRKQGRLKEARVYLEKACEEEDGEALFFRGEIARQGGWGMSVEGFATSQPYFVRSANAGCILGVLRTSPPHEIAAMSSSDSIVACYQTQHWSMTIPDHINSFKRAFAEGMWVVVYFIGTVAFREPSVCIDYIKRIADFGESVASRVVSRVFKSTRQTICCEEYLLRAAKHKHEESVRQIANFYFVAQKYGKGAKWTLKRADVKSALPSFLTSYRLDDPLRMQELYVYGRKFAKGWFPSCGHKQESLDIYNRSWSAAHGATVAFLLCCKKTGIYKDIARLIGKLVWKSRKDPMKNFKNKKLKR